MVRERKIGRKRKSKADMRKLVNMKGLKQNFFFYPKKSYRYIIKEESGEATWQFFGRYAVLSFYFKAFLAAGGTTL